MKKSPQVVFKQLIILVASNMLKKIYFFFVFSIQRNTNFYKFKISNMIISQLYGY